MSGVSSMTGGSGSGGDYDIEESYRTWNANNAAAVSPAGDGANGSGVAGVGAAGPGLDWRTMPRRPMGGGGAGAGVGGREGGGGIVDV